MTDGGTPRAVFRLKPQDLPEMSQDSLTSIGQLMETNDLYSAKLKRYIEERHIACEHLVFPKRCHSVAEAAQAAGVTPQDFVKNICMVDSTGSLVVAIREGRGPGKHVPGGQGLKGGKRPDRYPGGDAGSERLSLRRDPLLRLSRPLSHR